MEVEQIRLAANLAVFHVGLRAARGTIHSGRIPLAAARALEAGVRAHYCKTKPAGRAPALWLANRR